MNYLQRQRQNQLQLKRQTARHTSCGNCANQDAIRKSILASATGTVSSRRRFESSATGLARRGWKSGVGAKSATIDWLRRYAAEGLAAASLLKHKAENSWNGAGGGVIRGDEVPVFLLVLRFLAGRSEHVTASDLLLVQSTMNCQVFFWQCSVPVIQSSITNYYGVRLRHILSPYFPSHDFL